MNDNALQSIDKTVYSNRSKLNGTFSGALRWEGEGQHQSANFCPKSTTFFQSILRPLKQNKQKILNF